jgi:hypothetical protein
MYRRLQLDGTIEKTGEYRERNQGNVAAVYIRAIADAMEALRKVDRYGVSAGGKQNAQYEGYKALPPSADGKVSSREEAALFISTHSGWPVSSLNDADTLAKAYRQAATKLHPDRGGKHDDFVKLQDAYRVMGK